MRVGLLSGQVFSPFGEDWLAVSHGGGISSGMNIGIGCQTLHCQERQRRVRHIMHLWRGSVGSQNWGWWRCLMPYGDVCVLQACGRTRLSSSVSDTDRQRSLQLFVQLASGDVQLRRLFAGRRSLRRSRSTASDRVVYGDWSKVIV